MRSPPTSVRAGVLASMFHSRSDSIWTIGHSTRSFEEFLALLEEHRVRNLADVRHFPTSQRAPWATSESLPRILAKHGITYEHFEGLGGFRKARHDSGNTAWKRRGFRGYADHMASPEFAAALERLVRMASASPNAIMCAEAVPWKCHRSLLSDALVAKGFHVVHILSPGKTQDHRLPPFAEIREGVVTYPAPRKGA